MPTAEPQQTRPARAFFVPNRAALVRIVLLTSAMVGLYVWAAYSIEGFDPWSLPERLFASDGPTVWSAEQASPEELARIQAELAEISARPVRASPDWTQFQGSARDGTSRETGILREWPAEGPRQLWSVALGPGFGGPAVRDGEVYLYDREDDARDVLRCFSLASGEELWRVANPAPGRLGYNGSRTVPSVGERYVVAAGPMGHVVCVDRSTREIVWKTSLVDDFGGRAPSWGYAGSPLVVDGRVILAPLAAGAGLVALDVVTGAVQWKSPAVGRESYCSPALHRIGERQVVMFLGSSGLHAFDPESGATVLHYAGYRAGGAIPAPTAIGQGYFLLTAGYRAGTQLVRITDELEVQEIFTIASDGAQIHQAIFHEGHFYANFNTNENQRRPAGLVCIGLDGALQWKTEKAPALNRGNLIMVDGLLLVMGGDDGVLHLVEPDPEGYRELASAPMFEGLRRRDNEIWAPMAFADGKLVLRNQSQLKCVELRAP